MATFAFRLPDVGEGLHEGEIGKWLVQVGDQVREDQPLVEVQTDKVNVELPCPVTGKVLELRAQPGQVVPVGAVIAVFAVAGAAPAVAEPPAAAPAAAAPPAAAPAAAAAEAPAAPAARPPGRRALATPAVRRLARELGVDIQQVPGSGPAGRVMKEDVARFADPAAAPVAAAAASAAPAAAPAAPALPAPVSQQVPAAAPGQRIPLRGVRRAIAEAMVRSKHTAPHVTVMDEVEIGALVAAREQGKALAGARGIRLTYLPFIFKALVVALKEFPYLNASIDDAAGEIILKAEYNIGFALDTEQGLFVPVVKNADRKSIFDIAREIADLSEKGRAGKLTLEEIRGGTFSVSNMGNIGAGLYFTPVINHPEVGILGVGKIAARPVVRDGQVAVGQVLHLSLSFDHRIVDGAYATRFLKRVMELLANPTLLLMEA